AISFTLSCSCHQPDLPSFPHDALPISEKEYNEKMLTIPEGDREMFSKQWAKTKKYYDAYKKKLGDGGMFNIIIDPSKCKGCAERSEEHTSELQSRGHLVCRLLLEKKKT